MNVAQASYLALLKSGVTLVRVDQPSNLVLLKAENDLVPMSLRSGISGTSVNSNLTGAQLRVKRVMAHLRQ